MKVGLKKVGEIVTKEAVKGISNPPKTGRVYTYKGQLHQASAKGEYPANMSGALKKGINSKRTQNKLKINSKAEYSTFLEDATKKMTKRPFLIRAINDTSSQQLQALINEMDRRLVK